jgi:hypothetical protein
MRAAAAAAHRVGAANARTCTFCMQFSVLVKCMPIPGSVRPPGFGLFLATAGPVLYLPACSPVGQQVQAAAAGHTGICPVLLSLGLQAAVVMLRGWCPLHQAPMFGHVYVWPHNLDTRTTGN